MIIAQTVDKLIEPLAYIDRIDLYKEGMNLALTNMLYYCMPVFCDSKIVDKYYCAFVSMFRKKERSDIENFYQVTNDLINSCSSEKFKSDLIVVLQSIDIIENVLNEIDNFHLDVSATSLVILSDYWGKMIKDHFNIITDESKPLRHYEWIFEKMKSSSINEKEIGYGSRKIKLPLRINKLVFENSKHYIQIQIADLIAGACAYYGKSLTRYGKQDNLSKMIGKSKLAELFLNPIWPHKAFSPEDLNIDKSGNNSVEELTKRINLKS